MKQKLLAYAVLPVLGLGLLSAGAVSAHGFFFNSPSDMSPAQMATNQQDMFQRQADILGISVDKIKDGWADGKSLQTIAEENAISKDQLAEKMKKSQQDQMRTHLQALVDQGVITQGQADKRLQFMESRKEKVHTKGMMHRGPISWF